MSNKCDVFREARDQVAEKGRIRNRYFDGKCYCAVGYVLKAVGLTDDELRELGTSRIGTIYDRGYDNLLLSVNGKVYRAVSEAGICRSTLCELQIDNDDGENTDEVIVNAFDKFLKDANC